MMKSLCAIFGGLHDSAEFPFKKAFLLSTLLFTALALDQALSQPADRPLPYDLAERVAKKYGFSGQDAEELKAKGEITKFRKDAKEGLLLPNRQIADAIAEKLNAINPSLIVEAVFILPLDPKNAKKSDFELSIFNTLRSISTMKGIEYFSVSRGKMRVMFNDAYVVADPESRAPLQDPVEKQILPESVIYVFQNDSSFGKNAYETRYTRQGSMIQVAMKNLTEMYYGIVPLVEPGQLLLDLVVSPAEDHLLFYGCVGVKTYSLFGLEKRTHDSFSNRIKALYGWFSRELLRSFN